MSKKTIEWSRIALRYLWIAVAGSAAVVLISYLLALHEWDRERLSEQVRQSADYVSGLVQDPSPATATVRERAGHLAEKVRDMTRDVQPPAAQPPAPVATGPTPPAEAAPPETSPTDRWAVVANPNAPVYSLQGEFLLAMEAGALLDILDIRHTTEGDLAIANVVDGHTLSNILIRVESLDLHHGALDQIPVREKNMRIEHAQLSQRIADRKAELAEQARERNPHAKQFEAARKEYLAFHRRAQELTEKRDSAHGAKRMEYADELRKMLAERSRLRNEYEESKRRRDEWRASADGNETAAEDATLAQLRTRQHSLAAELQRRRRP